MKICVAARFSKYTKRERNAACRRKAEMKWEMVTLLTVVAVSLSKRLYNSRENKQHLIENIEAGENVRETSESNLLIPEAMLARYLRIYM